MSKVDKLNLSERIDLGIRRGAARAQLEHKLAGRPIYIWQDGQVVKVPPEEIVIDEKYLKDE